MYLNRKFRDVKSAVNKRTYCIPQEDDCVLVLIKATKRTILVVHIAQT